MIPPFDPDTGYLPPGEHEATWDEVVARFGWNDGRKRLLAGMKQAMDMLVAAGCARFWLNGSFVTSKDQPGDFDLSWDPTDVDLDALDPVFLNFTRGRIMMAAMFGGDVFPDVIEMTSGKPFSRFFQQDLEGRPKGIVVVAYETSALTRE